MIMKTIATTFLNFRTSTILLKAIVFLLVLLWTYTASSKLADFSGFKTEMANQPFSSAVTQLLVWTIPPIELLTAFLLLFNKTRLMGLYISFILMLLFTGYIALVLLGFYDRVPCSCGGVLKQLGWQAHFWFNKFFIFIIFIGIFLERRLRQKMM